MGDIKVYDFKKVEKFSTDNIRFLSLMSEEFCKTSNLQISYELKNKNLKLNMNETHQSNFGEFIEKVNYSSVIVEFKMKPLVENLVLSIDKYVALVMIDLVLGGDGSVIDTNRDLTNIDVELLQYLIEKLLKRINMPQGCEDVELSQVYTNMAQYQKFNSKDAVFNSTINTSLDGNKVGQINLCVPYSSMEPVLENLLYEKAEKQNTQEEKEECNIYENEMYKHIKNVDIEISATLGNTKINIIDLLKLETGDILLLDQKINDDITINIGQSKTYSGKVGLVGIKKAVEITEALNKEI
ncbi:MAG: flagellar motor switch protein FliM [Peptostreptococcaceae bacterium]